MTQLMPTKRRVPDEFALMYQYPNCMTLESIDDAIKERITRGSDALAAFLTVADGVKRWASKEGLW